MCDNDLDRILENGIAAYGVLEPRRGIEHRVLRKIEMRKRVGRVSSWLVAIPILATLAILALWAPPATRHAEPTHQIAGTSLDRKPVVAVRRNHVKPTAARRVARPSVFPSPSLPTAEEKAALRLAALKPEELEKALHWQMDQERPLALARIEIQPLTVSTED